MRADPQTRMALVRDRLASSTRRETNLRVMLVLAHELLRRDALLDEQPGATGRQLALSERPDDEKVDDYEALVRRIRATVVRMLPRKANVLVVSRGDDALFAPGMRMAHFPQGPDGIYAGHYPSDSNHAIAHLEQCRSAGAEFLLLPATGFWWLDYYGGLLQHLLWHGRVIHHDNHCVIFDLRTAPEGGPQR